MKQKFGILFSGGKDSNYVTYLAKQTNNEISCIITLSSKNPNSYMFQSVGNDIIDLQAKSMNIPLLRYETLGEKEEELQDLKDALLLAKEKYGITAVACGAIKSAYQSCRIQKICLELDLWCYNPIWQINEDEYMNSLLENNFDISIFGIFSYPFEKPLLGKQINQIQLNKLKQLRNEFQISIAGEGGEYESFILDSPIYTQKLELKDFKPQMDSENSGIITKCEVELTSKEDKQTQKNQNNQKLKFENNSKEKGEILIINLNQKDDILYQLEYIKPIYQILENENKTYQIIHYSEITNELIKQYNHIILSGTPLKEFEYLNHLNKFEFIKSSENLNKNILGICAGCQVIQKIFNSKENKIQEIGLFNPTIEKQDKILKGDSLKEIYALHSTSFEITKDFEIIAKTQIPQVIKHKNSNIYGTLFHPEVRNHQIIINFLNL